MIGALVSSRKFWGLVVALLCVGVLVGTGRVTGPQALEALQWLVGAWMGAVAVEDAAGKIAGRPAAQAPAATAIAVSPGDAAPAAQAPAGAPIGTSPGGSPPPALPDAQERATSPGG